MNISIGFGLLGMIKVYVRSAATCIDGPIFSQTAWDQDPGRVRINNLAKHLEQLQIK